MSCTLYTECPMNTDSWETDQKSSLIFELIFTIHLSTYVYMNGSWNINLQISPGVAIREAHCTLSQS